MIYDRITVFSVEVFLSVLFRSARLACVLNLSPSVAARGKQTQKGPLTHGVQLLAFTNIDRGFYSHSITQLFGVIGNVMDNLMYN